MPKGHETVINHKLCMINKLNSKRLLAKNEKVNFWYKPVSLKNVIMSREWNRNDYHHTLISKYIISNWL